MWNKKNTKESKGQRGTRRKNARKENTQEGNQTTKGTLPYPSPPIPPAPTLRKEISLRLKVIHFVKGYPLRLPVLFCKEKMQNLWRQNYLVLHHHCVILASSPSFPSLPSSSLITPTFFSPFTAASSSALYSLRIGSRRRPWGTLLLRQRIRHPVGCVSRQKSRSTSIYFLQQEPTGENNCVTMYARKQMHFIKMVPSVSITIICPICVINIFSSRCRWCGCHYRRTISLASFLTFLLFYLYLLSSFVFLHSPLLIPLPLNRSDPPAP